MVPGREDLRPGGQRNREAGSWDDGVSDPTEPPLRPSRLCPGNSRILHGIYHERHRPGGRPGKAARSRCRYQNRAAWSYAIPGSFRAQWGNDQTLLPDCGRLRGHPVSRSEEGKTCSANWGCRLPRGFVRRTESLPACLSGRRRTLVKHAGQGTGARPGKVPTALRNPVQRSRTIRRLRTRNGSADLVTPLGPRSVIIAHLLVAEQIGKHEPGMA